MPDCTSPQCHERMNAELAKRVTWERYDALTREVDQKMPKSWLKWWWLGFISVGIPMLAAAIGVWSGQQSDTLRYANKQDLVDCQMRIERIEESHKYLRRDLDEIKSGLVQIQANLNVIMPQIKRLMKPGEH